MKNKAIGWIGTGVMGKSMAGHLLKQGYSLQVYNRTASKADDLVKDGATYIDDPKQLAKNVDVLMMMVGYPSDLKTMTVDQDTGLL